MDQGHPEGRYANTFNVSYNAFEIVLDFGQQYVERPDIDVHSRIVTSPSYAKVLLTTLKETLAQFEQRYGEIPAAGESIESASSEATGPHGITDESGRTDMADRP